jgi:cyclic beta-1,2-glucan synthetase
MYRAGLESILGFQLQGNELRINPCVPRWWREFEITYRRNRAVYQIRVENPQGFSRGVSAVEVDGVVQKTDSILLTDEARQYKVRIVMGERVSAVEPRDEHAEQQTPS